MLLSAAVFLGVGLGSSSCGQCMIYCVSIQQLVLEDASGSPLTPLEVSDGVTVHRCAEAADGGIVDPFVTCSGNTISYDLRNGAPHSIRAEATSGEVFSGEITPVSKAVPKTGGSCSCGGSVLTPITVTLTKP